MGMPAIGLICQPPRLARGRLEAMVGADRAFALARALLEDGVALGREVARREAGQFVAFHAPADTGGEMAELLPGVALQAQADDAPGIRQERAAAHLFAQGASRAVLLTADAPTMPAALLELLFDALRSEADAGCIPALGGGYCAIGFARPLPNLLRELPSDPRELLAAMRNKATEQGLRFRELQSWHDVSVAADLPLLRATLDGQAPPNGSPLPAFAANATRSVLD